MISDSIADALAQRGLSSLQQEKPDPQVLSAVIRGLSQSQRESIRNDFISQLLHHPIAQRSDLLAAIAGRAWESLEDDSLRHRYLERLASNEEGQAFFNAILSDLLYLPATRPVMQASLRNPDRTPHLSQVIGAFFSQIRGK